MSQSNIVLPCAHSKNGYSVKSHVLTSKQYFCFQYKVPFRCSPGILGYGVMQESDLTILNQIQFCFIASSDIILIANVT